uniref:NADH dehydrogenase subunit 6 n=1 Tax=Plagiorchis elegans TaxID=99610 RepID=UPI0023AA65A4|nr:NADH dehydrogenase subunit 6 [Plagiorchis elegans]WCO87342.1 NADH dehydrogenase subunit 6 [Plagiorchis elegans]
MVSSFFLSLYLTSLLAFSFVSNPINYCLLLLLSSASITGYVYLMAGFSWYLILFCLVYVGGVYVLFIFISVHNPNPLPSLGGGVGSLFFFIVFFSFSFSIFSFFEPSYYDSSHYLCSFFEGFVYFIFCSILIMGFIIVSVVCSEKDSFFR